MAVTIIVLLILAAVAINLTVGENGIFTRAQNATQKWQEAEVNEQKEMNKATDFIEDYINDKGGSQGNEDGITWLEDVPIPDKFYYAGGSKDTGLVISDSVLDKKEYTEENKKSDVSTDLQGNQFVWVPVLEPNKIFKDEQEQLYGVRTTTDVYSLLTVREADKSEIQSGTPGQIDKVREPDVLKYYDTKEANYKKVLGFESTEEMANSMVLEYKAMSDSVKKYNGFYIGRYELTGSEDMPTEKKGSSLKTTSIGGGESYNWYELYKACKDVIKNNDNVKSTMIYGCQWDATMEWLKLTTFKDDKSKIDQDSSSWGAYRYGPIDTGSDPSYQANKIFDLAGNLSEWTQEAWTYQFRTLRGGCCDDDGTEKPASSRDLMNSTFSSFYGGSRATIYM